MLPPVSMFTKMQYRDNVECSVMTYVCAIVTKTGVCVVFRPVGHKVGTRDLHGSLKHNHGSVFLLCLQSFFCFVLYPQF